MSSIDRSEPEWADLRRAFERLVDLDAADRELELARSTLSEPAQSRLRRLLATADGEEQLLVPGRPIPLPPPVRGPTSGFALPHRLGRYELVAALGAGSMGEVFRARDSLLERDVAVKVLTASFVEDPRWLARFRREARAASALNHPNVMTVHDTGEHDGTHFLVAEFVDGETLRERLRRGIPPLAELIDCSLQIVGAVAAAHRAGIVHRDLKPENVMRRADGLLKVLDFGLAKTVAPPLSPEVVDGTGAGVLIGTLRYMAPEQARGEAVDARTDVFALGALLYELATGVPAFAGASSLDVLVALLDRDVPPLVRRRADLPPAFCAAVEQALQKDPRSRPPSAVELLATLEAVRAGPAATASLPAPPAVRYARSGEVNIAYQVLGSGPVDLVFVMGWISHLEWFWRESSFAAFLGKLAQFSRVILFDKRGTGLSDRVPTDRLPTLEQRIEDVRAVMDEVGSTNAVLCGVSEGGPMCALFAAAHPERTLGLVMIGSYARRLRSDDYPWGATPAEHEQFCREILATWGGPVGIAARAPSRAEDPAFRDWWAAYLRHGASPNAAVALTRMNAEIDIRPLLPTIGVPTLVVHRSGDQCLTVEQGRYLASCIPGAQMEELPGNDHLPFVGDQDAIVDAIARFVVRAQERPTPDRQFATLVRARLRDGTRADAVGRWQQAAMQADAVAQARCLFAAEGEVLAVFDGPVRAIRAAAEIQARAKGLALSAAVAVHLGELARRGLGIGGAVVDESEALVAATPEGAVLVSNSVRDLAAGAGIRFLPAPAVARADATIATWLVAP